MRSGSKELESGGKEQNWATAAVIRYAVERRKWYSKAGSMQPASRGRWAGENSPVDQTRSETNPKK